MHWNGKEQTLLELSMAGSEDEWKLLFVVSGYHVYKHVGFVFGGRVHDEASEMPIFVTSLQLP